MRHAIDIFLYGLTHLFRNLGAAIRLTGAIWVGASLLVFALGYLVTGLPIGALSVHPNSEGELPDFLATFTMASFVITLLAGAWVSLIWSRYCLGADVPRGYLPSLKGLPFGGYLISLLLLIGLVAVVNLAIGSTELITIRFLPLPITLFVLPLLTIGISVWFILRLGAALPATAAGQVLSLYQAWIGSRHQGIGLLTLFALIVIVVLNIPTVVLGGMPVINSVLSVISSWLLILMSTGWLVAIFRTIPPVAK
ncbi:hypothetical protein [uncultured Litoreibacter sp.]|uniref:hypothetical protein n=1 Tax=uncultured Litoreibacter sp. TaxID=1392394 RepID=UPI00260DC9AD|nr:hypothetical protein [uncultured Litoreibacter sp.]